MSQLLSAFGKRGQNLDLGSMKVDVEDRKYPSQYFNVVEFNPVFSAGRNPVAFNGSSLLANNSEILVECLDSDGNSLFIEKAKSTNSQFTDVSKFLISIHVYAETFSGPAQLILVGTTAKGEIVRWVGNVIIDKTKSNSSLVRFYTNPTLDVRSLLYPVVDVNLASTKVPPVVYRFPSATAITDTVVFSVSITNPGAGYTSKPMITISGATVDSTIDIGTGTLTSIIVLNGGSGYVSAPTVIIMGGGATTNATAVANITGIVKSVTVTNSGAGYTAVPTVVFLGLGSGAVAVPTLTNGGISSIAVTSGGFGYTSVPQVVFSSPNVTDVPTLNVPISFSSSFYAYAVTPPSNTNGLAVDKKRTTVDYRLVAKGLSDFALASTMSPTSSFNTQMEGSLITLNVKRVQLPTTRTEADAIESSIVNNTFTIKKVLDSQTIILSDAFYYQVGKDQLITDITEATFTSSYNFIQYNTNPESSLLFQQDVSAIPVPVKQSYAEVVYRNLKTYSGFVARHKLYRRSLFHPGDFQLISDEPLGAIELLNDTITFNKAYTKLGVFYNPFHASKYWFPSDPNVISIASETFPINSGFISTANPSTDMDGTQYVILKTDSIGVTPDNVYYSFDQTQFDNLTGPSYNSNFVSLKKNTLYILSTNIIMDKDFADTSAKVTFYFTSSIPSIRLEKDFNSTYGLKIGEAFTTDQTKRKFFNGTQTFFFTPSDDYNGTLVVVPYHCNITLSEISMKVYGDYGFSPEILFIRVPFSVNIKNEAFELKAELFDINHNLIFSDLREDKTFDATGASINQASNFSSVAFITSDPIAIKQQRLTIVSSFSVADSVYLPNLELNPGKPSRLVGWIFPDGSPDSGNLIYTNIEDVSVVPTNNLGTSTTDDYISVTTVDGLIQHNGKSLALHYSGSGPYESGRRIYINSNDTKSVFQ